MRLFLLAIFAFSSVSVAWGLNTEPASPVSAETEVEVVDILPKEARLLGEQEENGVLATAWLYRSPQVQEAEFPLILFIRFIGTENNILVEQGLVAYKIEDAEGHRATALRMNFKNGYFVAGLDSIDQASQTLLIGSKLEDEKKRQYRFALP